MQSNPLARPEDSTPAHGPSHESANSAASADSEEALLETIQRSSPVLLTQQRQAGEHLVLDAINPSAEVKICLEYK